MCLIFCDGARTERFCFILDALIWALFYSWWAAELWEHCFGKRVSETGTASALTGQSVQIHVRIDHKCHCWSFVVNVFLGGFSFVTSSHSPDCF